jgi:hypothetical protein
MPPLTMLYIVEDIGAPKLKSLDPFYSKFLLFQLVQIQRLDFKCVVLVPVEYDSRCENP